MNVLRRVQLVQLYLNQLASDKDAPIGDIHEQLGRACFLANTGPAEILQGLQRLIFGPIAALDRLIINSQTHNLCLWHGPMCDSTSRNKETGLFESIYYCPDCASCPV
jgi:hypothetical protein